MLLPRDGAGFPSSFLSGFTYLAYIKYGAYHMGGEPVQVGGKPGAISVSPNGFSLFLSLYILCCYLIP